LRECDVFFLGTARRKGGKRSRRDWREGIDQLNAGLATANETNTTPELVNDLKSDVRGRLRVEATRAAAMERFWLGPRDEAT
jgi:hypothetical protein